MAVLDKIPPHLLDHNVQGNQNAKSECEGKDFSPFNELIYSLNRILFCVINAGITNKDGV